MGGRVGLKKIGWFIFRIGVLLGFGIILLFNSAITWGQKVTDAQKSDLHIIFLIDNSLSMAGNVSDKILPSDPSGLRIKTAKLFIECLKSENTRWSSCKVAPIRFSNSVPIKNSYFFPIFPIFDEKVNDEIYSETLSGTDFVKALTKSLEVFRNESFGSEHKVIRAVILFTDGEPQDELERVEQQTQYFEKIGNIANKLKSEGVQLYLFGFGQNRWVRYWQPILSPGYYIVIPKMTDTNELKSIIQSVIDRCMIDSLSNYFSTPQTKKNQWVPYFIILFITISVLLIVIILVWQWIIEKKGKKIIYLNSTINALEEKLKAYKEISTSIEYTGELLNKFRETIKDPSRSNDTKKIFVELQRCFEDINLETMKRNTPYAVEMWEILLREEDDNNKREVIYENVKDTKGVSLMALAQVLKKRWIRHPEWMIEEMYGIIDKGNPYILEFLSKVEQ